MLAGRRLGIYDLCERRVTKAVGESVERPAAVVRGERRERKRFCSELKSAGQTIFTRS
jgi:hypothetical protein